MKKLLPFIVALLLSGSLFGQLPLGGLQAWYPFCGNYNDYSGNGYNLNNTGASLDLDRFAVPNTAYRFNGASSMNFTAIFLTGFSFTYSCWIKPATLQSSIIWFNGNPTTDGFGIYMNNGTIGTPGANVEVVFGGGLGQFSSTAVTLNAWHHIVLTKNGGAYNFYVDGVNAPFVGLPTFAAPTGQFTLGQNYVSGLDAFDGDIDDVAIYNLLLSTLQIDTLNTFDPDVTPFSLGGGATGDTSICTNSVKLSPPPSDTSGFTYSWNTGATTYSITVTPPGPPGTTYILTVTKPYGCQYSAAVNVHHLSVGVHIGPADTTFCTNGTIVLNPSPVAGEKYYWSNGDTTGSITVGGGGPGVYTYSVTVDSAGGCTGSASITIKIDSPVIVNLGPDTSSCTGAPITIKSSDGYAASSTYQWGGLPLPGGITTGFNYTVTTSGTYWLTVTNSGGCKGSDTQVVNIVYDTLRILNPVDTAICKNGSVQVRSFGNPAASNLWTPTAGIASALSVNPMITPDTSSWYKITATLLGCKTTDSIFIDVQPNPSVYIGGNRSVCAGDTLHILANVNPHWYTGYIYSWTPSVSLDASTTSVVVFTAGDSTDLILTVTTPAGCKGVDSAEIMVHTPHATILRDTSICPGDSLLLNPNPYGNDHYAWHPGIYLNDSNAVQPLAKPITTQFYWVYSTDKYGCYDTMSENIRVFPAAVINLGDSVVLYPGETYQISPQTNCVTFAWRPPLGLNDTAIANPIANPVVNTKFIVTAATEWGCYTTDSINVDIDPATLIALPNAFTPGANVNNYLYILKRGIAALNYFRIFNRWGNIVFETNNIDAGWDGTFNGKPQPYDVYVYDLQAVTDKGVVFHKTGNVTLIR